MGTGRERDQPVGQIRVRDPAVALLRPHGDWATDHFTREVTICEGAAAPTGDVSHYHAALTDSGQFQAVGLFSLLSL